MGKLSGVKTYVLITGASQGIGRAVAVEMAKLIGPGSRITLVARSESNLRKTMDLVKDANRELTVDIFDCDLSQPTIEEFKKFLPTNKDFDSFILVHNAGSEGNGSLAKDMNDLEEWQKYMALNLYSMTMLTSVFLKEVPLDRTTIVNVTSLCGIQPFKSMGYYGAGKAAREMYMNVLAKEEPTLSILNYAPGPVKTEMITRVIDKVLDSDTKTLFESMRDNQILLREEDTVGKMLRILDRGFESPARVDYYDAE